MVSALERVSQRVSGEVALFEDFGRKAAGRINIHGALAEGKLMRRMTGIRSAGAVGYKYFRHWVAVCSSHIARRCASQPINVARLVNKSGGRADLSEELGNEVAYGGKVIMPQHLKAHFRVGIDQELQAITSGTLVEVMDHPNAVQSRYEFTYTAVLSLFLTGEVYIMGGYAKDGRPELWSLPTHWVEPLHEGRLFSSYKLHPEPMAEGIPVSADNMIRLYFPDPSDPKGALSPVWSQLEAVIVDGQIQNSQKRAFDNGIFPGVLLKIGRVGGKNENPRKLMQPHQRRQLMVAAKRIWSGVAKSGEPLIVDGLVDEIEPFTRAPREMDWNDSQEWVRKRIFHAFGLNPINTGEIAGVNRAQAAVSEAHQSQNVINPALNQLSVGVCPFVVGLFAGRRSKTKTLIWWEPCKPHDDELEAKEWQAAAQVGSVFINEHRVQRLGLDPIPGGDVPAKFSDAPFLTAMASIASKVSAGELTETMAANLVARMTGLPQVQATELFAGGEALAKERVERAQQQAEQQAASRTAAGNAAGNASRGDDE